MGQPSESVSAMVSTSQLNWDGKCEQCRKLMSRCICFQEEVEGDVEPLATSAPFQVTPDATKSRPLWNALRKMHRKSVAHPTPLPPSTESSLIRQEPQLKRSEALPPLNAQPRHFPSSSRHHLHRLSEARPVKPESRYDSRRERSPDRSQKDRLQHTSRPVSSPVVKRDAKDAGVLRTVQSPRTIKKCDGGKDNHRVMATRSNEPEEGSDYENDETVWEL